MKPAGTATSYEDYPSWIVLIATLQQLSIFVIGAYLMGLLGLPWLIAYLVYLIWLELRLLRKSCVNCYYYGRRCAFGQGKLCSLFFRKGDPNAFLSHSLSWKDMLPDFLVSLVPFLVGIILLVRQFSWTVVALLVLLFLLTSLGNGFVRGSLACSHCRQLELGCPAEQLFKKRKK